MLTFRLNISPLWTEAMTLLAERLLGMCNVQMQITDQSVSVLCIFLLPHGLNVLCLHQGSHSHWAGGTGKKLRLWIPVVFGLCRISRVVVSRAPQGLIGPFCLEKWLSSDFPFWPAWSRPQGSLQTSLGFVLPYLPSASWCCLVHTNSCVSFASFCPLFLICQVWLRQSSASHVQCCAGASDRTWPTVALVHIGTGPHWGSLLVCSANNVLCS